MKINVNLSAKGVKKSTVFRYKNASPNGDAQSYFLRFLNRKLRKRMTFMTKKKRMKMISVRTGLLGAMVAKNIIGNPNTIAGKF